MKRPDHGFDRNQFHTEDKYVCNCGREQCWEADYEWMDWAEKRIAKLEMELGWSASLAAEQAEALDRANNDW